MKILVLLLLCISDASILLMAQIQSPSHPPARPLKLRGGAWLFEPKVATINKGYQSVIRWSKGGRKSGKGAEEEEGEESVPRCSDASQDPQRVRGIERTNDDSTMSKASACREGYLEDAFLRRGLYQTRLCRRTALINRGYFVRMELVRGLISSFIDRTAELQLGSQVVVLGAGYDTSYLHFKERQRLDHVRWMEIDLPAVLRRKSDMLRQDPLACAVAMCEELGKVGRDGRMLKHRLEQLQDVYTKHPELIRLDLGGEGTSLETSDLILVGGDLRELRELDEAVERTRFCSSHAPTLVLAECVLQYLEEEEVRRLLLWVRQRFPNAVLVSYDQTGPCDLFGQVMTSSLKRKEQALKAISSSPDAAALQRRLLETGWEESNSIPLSYLYEQVLMRGRVEEGERREKFDEEEEWKEKCKHYCLSWAITSSASMSQLVQPFPRWRASAAGAERGEKEEGIVAPPSANKEVLLRASCIYACDGDSGAGAGGFWGHASVKIRDELWIFGGQTSSGGRSNQLLRASLSPAPALDPSANETGRAVMVENLSGLKGEPSPRVWHAACSVFDRYLVVHGGRSSPPNPVETEEEEEKEEERASVMSDVAVLDTQERVWKRMLCAGNPPPPTFRHRAGVLATENEQVEIVVLLGGISPRRGSAAGAGAGAGAGSGTGAGIVAGAGSGAKALVLKLGHGKEELQASWCEVSLSGSTPPSSAIGRTVTADGGRNLLLFGGYDPTTRLLSDRLYRISLLGLDMGRRTVRLISEELTTWGTRPCARFAHSACLLLLPRAGGEENKKFLLVGGGCTDQEEAADLSFPLYALDLDRLTWQELHVPPHSSAPLLCSIKTDMWAGGTWSTRKSEGGGQEEEEKEEGGEGRGGSDVYIVGGGLTCFSFGSHFNSPISTFKLTMRQGKT